MSDLTTQEFRTLGPSDAIPDDFVVPYYLADRKRPHLGRPRRRPLVRVR